MIWAYTEWEREGRSKADGEISKGMADICTWCFFLLKIIFLWFRKKKPQTPEGQNHQTICLVRIVLWKEYQILALRP